MASEPLPRRKRTRARREVRRFGIFFGPIVSVLLGSVWPTVSFSASWEVVPSLELRGNYTDNVRLEPDEGQEDFVSEIVPGLKMEGVGRRLSFDFNYKMQNLFYARNSDSDRTWHQLAADANAELARDWLFLDVVGRVYQTNTTLADPLSDSNIQLTGNRTSVRTARISPYVRHSFGTYSDFDARLSFIRTSNDPEEEPSTLSDSNEMGLDVRLDSGPRFRRSGYRLRFNRRDQQRESAPDFNRQNSRGEVFYKLNSRLSFLVSVGREDNDAQGATRNVNGTYTAAGLTWTPNPSVTVEAETGRNREAASLDWNPTRRTNLRLAWRDQAIGLDPGSKWEGTFTHRMRNTVWDASYREITTTTQSVLSEPGVIEGTDPTGQPIFIPVEVSTLTDEVFLRKLFRFSVLNETAKRTLRVFISQEDREFEETNESDTVLTGRGSWEWHFAARTSMTLSGYVQQIDFRDSDRQDDWYQVKLQFDRQISRKSNALLALSHMKRESNEPDASYEEQLVSVAMTVNF